jgi:ketosteroid isomerase-like protein
VYAKLATKSYDKALQLDKNNTTAQAKLTLIKSLFDKNPVAAPETKPAAATHAEAAPEPARTTDAGKPVAKEPAKPADAGKSAAKDPASDEAAAAVRSWATAWSSKDVDAYLGFYASDFKTPNGESRAAWEKLRRERLGKPGAIQVQIGDLNVTLTDKSSAQVSFQQKYSSSNLKATNQKTLLLHRNGSKWQIVEERVRG